MSPIKGLQPRPTEIGRIRAGDTYIRGKKRLPKKLEHWRLTSSHLEAIQAAAKVYGGEVGEWSEGHGSQFELLTQTDTLHVLVPPQDPVSSQYLELWSGGGVVRRCDGETELVSGGACICAGEDERPCKPTTHLRVVLPELPGLGVWRLSTQSWAAAAEIPAALSMLEQIRSSWEMPAADLVLEQRQSVSGGQTRDFAVPVLVLPYSLSELAAAARPPLPPAGVDPETGEILPSSTASEAGTPAATEAPKGYGEGPDGSTAAAGTTSEGEVLVGPQPAHGGRPSDTPGPGADPIESFDPSQTSAPGDRDCLHLNGTRTVIRDSDGAKVEVCKDCHHPVEVLA